MLYVFIMLMFIVFSCLNLLIVVSAVWLYKFWLSMHLSAVFSDLLHIVKNFKQVMNSVAGTMDVVAKTSPFLATSTTAACDEMTKDAIKVGETLLHVAQKTEKITTQVDDLITFASIWGAIIALIAVIPYAIRKLREIVPETVAEALPRSRSLDKLEKIAYVLAYIAGAGKLLIYLKDWMKLDSVLVQLFDMSPGQMFDMFTFAGPSDEEKKKKDNSGVGFVPGPILSPGAPYPATACSYVYPDNEFFRYTAAECAAMKVDDAIAVQRELLNEFAALIARRNPSQAERDAYNAKMAALKHAELRNGFPRTDSADGYIKLAAAAADLRATDVPQSLTLKDAKDTFDKCLLSWQNSPRHYRLAFVIILVVLGLLSWYVYDRMQEDHDEDENDEDAESRRHFKKKGGRKVKKSGEKSYEEDEKPDPLIRQVAVDKNTDQSPITHAPSRYLDEKPTNNKYVDTKINWADAVEEDDWKEQEKKPTIKESVRPPVPPVVAVAKVTRSQQRREKLKKKLLAEAQAESSVKKEAMMRDSKVTVTTGDVIAIRDGINGEHTLEGRTFALNGHLVTAAHNLTKGTLFGWVQDPSNKGFIADKNFVKPVHKIEFTLIEDDIAVSKKVAPFPIKSLRASATSMKIGDKILIRKDNTSCSPGEIVSLKGKRIEHNASTTAGWSGSPVVFGSTVIGVHVATNPSLGVNVAHKLPLNFLAPGGFRSAGSMEPKRQ